MSNDAVIDVVHKTIYGFFDVAADDSEEPMSEKDKLLLEVNKAVCNAIKEMPEERKTGRWNEDGTCSVCGAYSSLNLNKVKYCPECGAKMEGAE